MLGFLIKKCIPYTYHGYEEAAQSQSLLILDGFICVKLNENSNNKYSYKKSCESKIPNSITFFFFLAIWRDPFFEGFNWIFFNLDDFLRINQGYNSNYA